MLLAEAAAAAAGSDKEILILDSVADRRVQLTPGIAACCSDTDATDPCRPLYSFIALANDMQNALHASSNDSLTFIYVLYVGSHAVLFFIPRQLGFNLA